MTEDEALAKFGLTPDPSLLDEIRRRLRSEAAPTLIQRQRPHSSLTRNRKVGRQGHGAVDPQGGEAEWTS